MKKNWTLLLLSLTIFFKTKADVKPNSLFSDNMVLQSGTNVPVWGKADDDEEITIAFCGQKVRTKAKDGKWFVKLKPLKPGGPFEMKISGKNSITIKNVLVGEVWICSGQSNMEMALGGFWPLPITNAKEEIANANYPLIRQYQIRKGRASDTLVYDANSMWQVCDTSNAKNFSAVGYFFARDLFNHLRVPIGLLFTAWGGTPAERWTPRDVLAADTGLKKIVDAYYQAVKEYPLDRAKYKEEEAAKMAKWVADTLAASLARKPIPKKPSPPSNPLGGAGGLYNSMINPLIPYAIKGVIWYQGEADRDKAEQYKRLFPTMINAWRNNFGQGPFPFLYAMVAPWMNMTPAIREAQLSTLSNVPNTAMISTIDCGDSLYIHPPYKQPVGARFALAARAIAYKEKIAYSGPMLKRFKILDNAIEISFTHIGKGLECKNDELIGFTIAGENKIFVPAKAIIKGDKVIVSHPDIPKPLFVRFAWANFPRINLYNKDGLPGVPFKTDVD